MNVIVNGRSVRCEADGPDDAPAIVFVHGLAASLRAWQGQAERLAARFRVVRYDLRSHGGSDAVDEPCARGDLAADLIGLLDALGIDRAVVVGHSAGGVIAMQAALDHPRRVRGLVLVGTASECNDKTAAWYARTAEAARERGGAAAVKALGLKAGDDPVPDGNGFAHLTAAMRSLNRDPLTDALVDLDLPTLIVVGERDFLGVGGSVILSRTIARSELVIVPERGHGIYIEDPDWFAGRIEQFVDGLDAG